MQTFGQNGANLAREYRMRALVSLPFSLLAFPLVAILYALQVIPVVGLFLMLLGAPFWTGMLVNAGMLGLSIEVPIRRFAFAEARTSLLWLLVPFAYFGWYGINAFNDHKTLQNLRAEFDAANEKVLVPFDAERHSLVLVSGAHTYAGTLTQDFGLPVAYSENENVTGGYLSTRLLEKDLCAEIRNEPLMSAAFIHTFGFHDGDRIGHRRLASNFCSLRMPAKPQNAPVTVANVQTETLVEGLPVKLIENVITMPDGTKHVLHGGTAAPYPWFPMPVLGCALNSGAPSWDCFHGFSRDSFTPIVTSATRYGGDVRVLATALELTPTEPQNRRATDREFVEDQLREVVGLQLERDIADLREAVTDPASQMTVHSIKVLERTPDVLLSLAPTIVEGIKRAAQITDNPYRNRETGRTLARLFGKLPYDAQDQYADDMALIYKRADEANDGRHWLYQADDLLRFRPPCCGTSER
jgi:hypothetical protein